jgi:hypothetical protein
MHVLEELTDKKKMIGMRQYQEPLMVKFVEYLSDGCEEGFPWLR